MEHSSHSRAAQRAAWDTYFAVTTSLIPALGVEPSRRDATVNPRLGAVVLRIHRYAPMWDEHGRMLACAGRSAIRLYRHGEWSDLAALLAVIAERLYTLSLGLPPPRQGPGGRRAP
jgi:hypothetical protein